MLCPRYTGCIYLATNTVNGRAYVGKTIMPLFNRKAVHAHAARRPISKSAFHCALRKYGADAFVWTKLFESDDEPTLFEAERGLIVDYRSAGIRLYNLSGGGEGQSIPCTEDRRAKVSRAMKGRKLTSEHRLKCSLSQKGRPRNPVSIAKMRQTKMGKKLSPWSEERRLKCAATWAAKKAAGTSGHSPATRIKLKVAAKLRASKPEERQRLKAIARLGAEKRWSR